MTFFQRLLAVLLICSLPAFGCSAAERPSLDITVHRTGEGSLYTNLTLIVGEKKAVLVDAPFTRSDAYRLVGTILDSGRDLETIFVTHDHPDHFFSIEVLMQAFPNAQVVAHPSVVADIWRSLPLKVKRWGPLLGNNGPKTPTAPAPLEGDTILLEGHELKVLGPFQGDHVHSTALHIPSISALVAGDLIHNEMFLWLAECDREAVQAWRNTLEVLGKLNLEIVVPGHSKEGIKNDISALAYTKKFLDIWLKESAAAQDSADLRARIIKAFPNSIDVMGDFLLGTSSRVAMGEEEIWSE